MVTLTNVCNWMVGLFPERAQDEVFGADPDARVSGVLAPTATTRRVDGGWRVTGRWYYNSGSWHTTWAASASRSPTSRARRSHTPAVASGNAAASTTVIGGSPS